MLDVGHLSKILYQLGKFKKQTKNMWIKSIQVFF